MAHLLLNMIMIVIVIVIMIMISLTLIPYGEQYAIMVTISKLR